MADMHSLFLKFNDNITLSSSKADFLKTSRDAIRRDIKNGFQIMIKSSLNFVGKGHFL